MLAGPTERVQIGILSQSMLCSTRGLSSNRVNILSCDGEVIHMESGMLMFELTLVVMIERCWSCLNIISHQHVIVHFGIVSRNMSHL